MTISDFPRVHIATDHAGMELSAHLVSHLSAKGYEIGRASCRERVL